MNVQDIRNKAINWWDNELSDIEKASVCRVCLNGFKGIHDINDDDKESMYKGWFGIQ